MSRTEGQAGRTREELVLWLREEIASLEQRLEAMRALLALLEQRELSPALGERVEEVKVGRRRIARVMTGEDYVRVVFEEPMKVPQEIREYLGTIEQELRALQARAGEEELAKLKYNEVNGSVVEIRYDQLYTTVETLKARAALKYAAEAAYHLLKAMEREQD
ncbi:MAG: hypothetical protein NZ902_02475 [Acidilobaceae archaeon]|nr:hypothetical protein [Acidilobaceae archaeon]MCX8165685.1 hypothetical protein [Acidilobaceae archaeon]MDW7974110.1 hypothetical protein [Sulfolobales archaeon]